MANFLGLDIGGTHIRAGLVTDEGKIIDFYKIKTEANRGSGGVIDRIVGIMDIIRSKNPDAPISGIGIGIAGILKPKRGIVCFSPNLPGWKNVELYKILKERLKTPIWIENDANLIALGEKWLGAGRNIDNFMLLTLGTGVGGGLIYKGKLFTGETSAAEIGHLKIEPEGQLCLCGRKGCLETFASATWLIRRARKERDAGMPSILDKSTLNAENIFLAAKAGDILAEYLFRKAGWALGIAIANILNVLGFNTVIIGGGVSNAWDAFIGTLKYTLMSELLSIFYDEVQVLKSILGDMAGIYGACYLAKQNLSED
ncbi:MAG: hypothetical protein AMJ45_03280 [Syntrophobacter sp. DG_60]|nr:MAG: hypothetical protein AMJ45_03280 [Syntrophobacter sp. DG_60]